MYNESIKLSIVLNNESEMKCSMKRITILLGAGAMIEATGLGTGVLTDKVFESCKKYKLKSGEEILREFAKDFAKKHSKTMYPKDASFEDLFDILECYMDYQNQDFNDTGSVILSTIKDKYIVDDKTALFGLRRDFLDTINNAINEYDQEYSKEGAWMTSFFHSLIKNEKCFLDVFTLNYDTWMEQILGNYVDGFIDINKFNGLKNAYDGLMRFSPSVYLNPLNNHTISHLHGQICFEESDLKSEDVNAFMFEEQEYTLYKYSTFKQAQDLRNRRIRSNLNSQSGHTIFPTNIITGRMKTDKMVWSPMQIYMHGLMKALMNNEDLIIIGYGFGDLYVNTLLFQYLQKHKDNKRVRLITYCSEKQFDDEVCAYHSLFQGRQAVFAQCMMGNPGWCTYNRKSYYESKVSDAGIYIDGFKKYSEDYISGKL